MVKEYQSNSTFSLIPIRDGGNEGDGGRGDGMKGVIGVMWVMVVRKMQGQMFEKKIHAKTK